LGEIIGNQTGEEKYKKKLADNWIKQINTLAEVTISEPLMLR